MKASFYLCIDSMKTYVSKVTVTPEGDVETELARDVKDAIAFKSELLATYCRNMLLESRNFKSNVSIIAVYK